MKLSFYINRIAAGLLISIILFGVMLVYDFRLFGSAFMFGFSPSYEGNAFTNNTRTGNNIDSLMKFGYEGNEDSPVENLQEVFAGETSSTPAPVERIESTVVRTGAVVGKNDIMYQTDQKDALADEKSEDVLPLGSYAEKDELLTLITESFLKKNFYTFNANTAFSEKDFNIEQFLNTDFNIAGGSPKVLIFHTHMYEGYSDSDDGKLSDGVYGIGEMLAQTLTNTYGIPALHVSQRFDLVDGKVSTQGAYERMEPVISQILKDNPSIEVVIDLHRDGVKENQRFVTDINGKPTAKVMFVNGISKILENGILTPINSLKNENLETNLAFSFNMQLTLNELAPGLMRKMYIHAYRLSLHMLPKSLLIEVGAQTNTIEEAQNTVPYIAEALNTLLKKKN